MQEDVKLEDWPYAKPAATEIEATKRLRKMVQTYLDYHQMTQAKFCEASGDVITRAQLQPLLMGERKMVSMWLMTHIARAMNMPLQVLLGRCGLSSHRHTKETEDLALACDYAMKTLSPEEWTEFAEGTLEELNALLEKVGKKPFRS